MTRIGFLHLVARVALRVAAPARAKRFVDWVGLAFRPTSDALDEAAGLRASGTCLSRALALSARLPGSAVVIGIDQPPRLGFRAHAWVERAGKPVCQDDAHGTVIARVL